MLRVHSIETLGTYDGPGIRLVVFLQGCNYKCLYCANPDTIELGTGTIMPAENILKMARNQRPFFGNTGGITVSGGEPLLQAGPLLPLFKMLKNEGFNTCIDTNGSVLSTAVKELLHYTDLVLLDIKHIDSQKHTLITGKPNTKVLAFAEHLSEIGIPVWMRYVLIPGYSDDEADLHNLGRFLASLGNVKKLEIQPYHRLGVHKYEALGWEYKIPDVPSNTVEQLSRAKTLLRQYIGEVIVN